MQCKINFYQIFLFGRIPLTIRQIYNYVNLNDIFSKNNENANYIPKNFNIISEETSVNISNGTLGS